MLPVLHVASDGREHTLAEAVDLVARELSLSAQDRDTLTPDGTQTLLYNRVTWAVSRLVKAGLLERPGRGRFQVTPRGNAVLSQGPQRIDDAHLDPSNRTFTVRNPVA